MKRFGLFLLIILLISQVLTASEWEGTGTLSSSGLLPDEGFYVATNAFPRNTIVNLMNLDTRQTVKVIVAAGLDSPGMLAMVSKDAAQAIGLMSTAIGRIRISTNDIGSSFIYPTEAISSNADPDYNPRAAVTQYTGNTRTPAETEVLPSESDWIYPEEIETNVPEIADFPSDIPIERNDTVEIVDIPEQYTPSAAAARDDAIVPEMPPETAWVYPQEIDETLAKNNSPAKEDLSKGEIILIPENNIDPVPETIADETPEIHEAPETSLAVVEPETIKEDVPETNEPPVSIDADDKPSLALVPSGAAEASQENEGPAEVTEEVYETPESSIAVVEPGFSDEDFPETNTPPVLSGGDGEPSVALIPSGSIETLHGNEQPAEETEEVYETPESSIAVVEPGFGDEDFPETSMPPVLTGSDDPSVAVISSELPPSRTETGSSEESYERPGSSIAVVEPGSAEESSPLDQAELNTPNESTGDNTETLLSFVPAGEKPPEQSPYELPSESEIEPLPQSPGSANNAALANASDGRMNHRFSVESISELEPGAYYVQLGTFTEIDSVEQVISGIPNSYPLKVHWSPNSTSPRYRVLLGPVNVGEGSALLQRFKTRGYSESFIIPSPRY